MNAPLTTPHVLTFELLLELLRKRPFEPFKIYYLEDKTCTVFGSDDIAGHKLSPHFTFVGRGSSSIGDTIYFRDVIKMTRFVEEPLMTPANN